MRDGRRSGARWWAVGEWSLRWKVTALVAIPLVIALSMGGARIRSTLVDAHRLQKVSDNIDIVPGVTSLTATVSTVAGGAASGTIKDEDVAAGDKALTDLDHIMTTRRLPQARPALDDMLMTARSILADAKAQSASISELRDRVDRVRNDAIKVLDAVVGQVSDARVNAARIQLIDSMNARAQLYDVLVAMVRMLRDQKFPDVEFLEAETAERAMLTVLSRHFPDKDPTITDLHKGIDSRLQLVESNLEPRQLPVFDLRDSMLDSTATYTRIGAAATKQITTVVHDEFRTAQTTAIRDGSLLIAALLLELVLAVLAARSLVRPLRRLREAAQQMADKDLPNEIDRIKDGAGVADVVPTPMPVRTAEEVGQLARTIDDIHGQALRLAGEQAQLRLQVSDMFETLARRSKSLVDHQLGLIEAMEYEEKDPKLLEGLFRLDHLAARMRRNSDNLLILAGTKMRRTKAAPVEIGDVLRAAISEVEEYQRVKLGATPRGSLVEPAASDIAHLFAELLDNALRASPPETDVKFTFAQANDQGLLIEVADRGIGVPAMDLAAINERLEAGAEISADTARHMGLFVVSRLAERHGLTVRMRPTFDIARDPGITVSVHIPRELIIGGSVLAGGGASPAAPASLNRSAVPESTSQIRSVTRTASGNMMVTVDPSPSQPLPVLPKRMPGGSIMPDGLTQQPPPTLEPTEKQREPVSQQSQPAQVEPTVVPEPAEPQSPASPTGDQTPPSALEQTAAMPVVPAGNAGSNEDTGVLPALPRRKPKQSPRPESSAAQSENGGRNRSPSSERPAEPASAGRLDRVSQAERAARAERAAAASAQRAAAERERLAADKAAAEKAKADAAAKAAARQAWEEAGQSSGPGRLGRAADTAKTASFFQSRNKNAADEDTTATPIFAEMMSGWLADWQQGMPRPAFESIADEGWTAAARAAEATPDEHTQSGLPQRQPGRRLIPGAVGAMVNTTEVPVPETEADTEPARGPVRRRDPETVRSSLARHQAGVRNGRAVSTMKVTGDEGEQ